MKKIFYIIIAAVLCMAFILPVGAIESEVENSTVGKIEEGTGAESEKLTAVETLQGDVTEQVLESETADIGEIIENADSKLDAIAAIANAMGITLEEAEAFLDKMVSLGDEHFGESDLWADVKASISEDPEAWTVAALVVLMLLALVIFLIRGLIKNTTAQAATKANIADIKAVLGIDNDSGKSMTIDSLEKKIGGVGATAGRLESLLDLQSAAIIAALGEVLEAIRGEDAKLSVIEGNSAASLKINSEQALQIVQLLNIALGRQMPKVSDATRKVWYDDSVSKIKEAAGVKEPTDNAQ